MNHLKAIGLRHGTDKAVHNFKGVTYLDVYAEYVPVHAVDCAPTVDCMLEIGVYKGASLRTWREYFPKTTEVWGLDIDPSVAKGDPLIVTGSQTDPEAIAKVAPGKLFDLVVDDGSHLVQHIITSFELIWPRVAPGGLYVIEDLLMSYVEDMSSTHRDSVAGVSWPGQKYNNPEECRNERWRFNSWIMGKIGALDRQEGNIRSISFHSEIVFIRKV
jgi:hypothetical protein